MIVIGRARKTRHNTMHSARFTHPTDGVVRRRSRRILSKGFSLIELMVVVSVIGIMAAMAAPSFQLAVRQSRADIAGANLRAIWAAERLYWLEYHSYTDKMRAQTAPLIGLVDLGLLDPDIFNSGNYTYAIASYTDNTFTATATSPDGDITITIDETGAVESTGIALGFQ